MIVDICRHGERVGADCGTGTSQIRAIPVHHLDRVGVSARPLPRRQRDDLIGGPPCKQVGHSIQTDTVA